MCFILFTVVFVSLMVIWALREVSAALMAKELACSFMLAVVEFCGGKAYEEHSNVFCVDKIFPHLPSLSHIAKTIWFKKREAKLSDFMSKEEISQYGIIDIVGTTIVFE